MRRIPSKTSSESSTPSCLANCLRSPMSRRSDSFLARTCKLSLISGLACRVTLEPSPIFSLSSLFFDVEFLC